MMLSRYLKIFVLTTTLGVAVSFDVFKSIMINPGKGVNFYGDIQSNPTHSKQSAEKAFYELEYPCTNDNYLAECDAGPLYHHPGILYQIENPVKCNYSDPYRTYDGTCNNPNINRLGMVNQCYGRILPPYYEGYDGFRQSVEGGPLPPPRKISVEIFQDYHRPQVNVSQQFAFFGEYTMRDLIHSDHKNIDCCNEKNMDRSECMPIAVSPDDPFFSKFNKTCINFRRTLQCDGEPLKAAPADAATAYMDDSQLYGVSKRSAVDARTLDGTGQIRHNDSSIGSFLPSGSNPNDVFCPKDIRMSCFEGTDPRLNMHAVVISHNNLFMREHNRLAKELKKMNPKWGDEKLYQEARKIHIAEHQCILYKEFMPILVTPRINKALGMQVTSGSSGIRYNSSVLAGIFNEFAIASFRLHSIIATKTGSFGLPFKDYFSNPLLIRHNGSFTELFNGLRSVPAEMNDRYVVNDLTDYLFKFPGQQYGADLVSINIQRGRDHGLAPYIESVKFCSEGTVLIKSFDDLHELGLMRKEYVNVLKKVYKAVEDVDMWVGMHLETPLPGGITGPTATCINAKQFYFVQRGDRFYFDNSGPDAPFTTDQRNTLKECSFARLLCDNTEISKVTRHPFLLPSDKNSEVSCSKIPKVDLSYWKNN